MRLDRLLQERYPDFSRSRLEGLVKAGYVTVNGAVAAKAGMKVAEADEIEVEIPPPVPAVPQGEAIALKVVYEDEEIVVIDKAAGMVVHPAPGHHTGTLVNALLHHCPTLAGIGGVARPGIVHRLDQYTSGLIVVAKTDRAMDSLVRQFSSHRELEKTYLAIVHRPVAGSAAFGRAQGRIENLIARHPVDRKRMAVVERGGKRAVTRWRVKRELARGLLLVECLIETGRTHQIRVHLASIGMGIVGDAVYGRSALDRSLAIVPGRQLLHAWKLRLRHPASGEAVEFTAEIPADMAAYL